MSWPLIALGLLTLSAAAPAEQDPAPAIVVELFTSQGCSSCPPADRLLRRLAAEDGVIALSFHVDYWNRLGWIDPFSSSQWSARQSWYSQLFHLQSVYTPQVVIDGRHQLVGSDEAGIRRVLEELRAERNQGVHLALEASATVGEIALRVTLEEANGQVLAADSRLLLAVVENGLSTAVPRGENADKTLRHDQVVRSLEEVAAELGEQRYALAVDRPWRRDRLAVVALVQDPDSGSILAASRLDL